MSIYDDYNKPVNNQTNNDDTVFTINDQLTALVDFDDNVIFINGEIEDVTMAHFIIKARALIKKNNPSVINVIINSVGGDMADAWGIIDFIKSSNVKFNTICRGNALSAAALILLAGTGSRVASKHATIMLHQPMMYLESSDYTRISNVMRNAEYSRIQLDQFYTFLGASTNKDKVWWETMLRDDMWLTATDAQQLNIIDSII